MFWFGNKPDLLKNTRIVVSSEHDLVVIKVGNIRWKIPYEQAFQLSQFIRFRAKEAKARAGDSSRHWSVIGQLHDANYGPDHTRING
jgi:hypothetical protein